MNISESVLGLTLADLHSAVSEEKNISVFGLSLGEKSIFLSTLKKQIVFVSQNMNECNKLAKELKSFGKNVKTIFFKQSEFLLGKTFGSNYENLIETLTALCTEKVDCLIITPDILLQKMPLKNSFEKFFITLKKGGTVNVKLLIHSLNNMGYKRCDIISSVGDYSVRGDIVDIFPISAENPIRIEFFDDEIESINTFSVTDFKKIEEKKAVTISPLIIYSVESENKSQLFAEIEKDFNKTTGKLETSQAIFLKSNFEEFKLNYESENYSQIQNWLIPFHPNNSIFSYTQKDCLVVFDDVKQIVDSVNTSYQEFTSSLEALLPSGDILLKHTDFYIPSNLVYDIPRQMLSFQKITTSNRIFNPEAVLSYKSSAETNYFGNYNLLLEDVNYYLEFKNTVVIFSGNKSTCEYLTKFLSSQNIDCVLTTLESVEKNKVNIVNLNVPYGAIFVEDKLAIIGAEELNKPTVEKKVVATNKKEEFTMPKAGEYVVHETFGIGLCVGVEKLKFTDYEKDYIILQYGSGDKLYLPTEQIGLISAYVSGGKEPKLNKLGSKDFEKTKQKVKSSLKELAFDLIKLYSEREHAKGFKCEIDAPMFKQFENSFQFSETTDQISAINDVKKDMCSNKIMDRLVCGDVGYGKTEVALRAAFIAALNNKQVCFLAPTTILSQQHFNNAKERLSKFGIVVECLNRFKTKKEQNEIVKKIKNGEVDIVCGTHRLLSKDVVFKDLGLLVLDEEQRFGVGDKEKIKRLKSNIDVLTLSATPIPRTLHMGLVGIRDISIISTPPEGRLPVQTTVAEISDGLLLQAINREISRNGQVLIVYNRIEDIYNFAGYIKNLIKADVSIGVAHGQMDEKELENQILNLYDGKTQILISTTLIENGVDLPNANTLIIVDADRLGLSQLYQLKGRVGRSKNLGYAYFTYDKQKTLSEDAYKRLNAILEFTELGSGFKIAMKDLEIRGCGNILGPEQSGHMAKVGYDMYCKILSEAVMEIRGNKQREYKDIKLDVAINCYIPENFIESSENRFRIYSNLKQIGSGAEREAILKEIEAMYGKTPEEIENLSFVAMLRNMAREFDVKRISIDRSRCQAEFYSKEMMLSKNIVDALNPVGVKVYFSQDAIIMNFMLSEYSVKKKLQIVCEVFEKALQNLQKTAENKSKK